LKNLKEIFLVGEKILSKANFRVDASEDELFTHIFLLIFIFHFLESPEFKLDFLLHIRKIKESIKSPI
jgi:hypothetical protein